MRRLPRRRLLRRLSSRSRDPALVAVGHRRRLGSAQPGGRPPAAGALLDYLRDDQVLLVLDNFEQVVDGRGWSPQLLRDGRQLQGPGHQPQPAARLRRAGVPGAAAAACPDRRHRPRTQRAQFEAVALFVERALAVAARTSRLTDENAAGRRRDRAGGSTACRSPSSWPPRGSGSCRSRRFASALDQRLRAADRRRARPAGAPADAARRDRLELRPARSRRTGASSSVSRSSRRRRASTQAEPVCGPPTSWARTCWTDCRRWPTRAWCGPSPPSRTRAS